MDIPPPSPPLSPRSPPPLPASLPPLPEEQEHEEEEEEEQPPQPDRTEKEQQPPQQQERLRPPTPTPTPPLSQPRTAVPLPLPLPPLPVLRRSGPSEWEEGELRRRYRALEGERAALAAAVQEKDEEIKSKEGDVKLLMRKALAEARAREEALLMAAEVAAHGLRLEEEYGELKTAFEGLQRRLRELRASGARAGGLVGRLERQNQEAAAALTNARQLLGTSNARIHALEERRLQGEREAQRLQSHVTQLERALSEARRAQRAAEAKEAAAAHEHRRPPPTVPTPTAPPPSPPAGSSSSSSGGVGEVDLERILQANLRLQEQLKQRHDLKKQPPPVETEIPSTTTIHHVRPSPPPPPPSPPSHILGGFPRVGPKNNDNNNHRLVPIVVVERKPPDVVRLYGYDPARVTEGIAAARAEARRAGLAHHKPLSWGEAGAILCLLHQHRRCPPSQSFPAIGALACIRRNSTVDQPTSVLRAFLHALGE